MSVYFVNRSPQPAAWETTPEGFLRCRARILSNSILEYLQNELAAPIPGAPDPVRMLVTREEMAAPEALRSLEGCPVVAWDHTWLAPGLVAQHAVGSVAGAPRLVGDYLECDLLVTDPAVIEDIRAGRLQEISAAYAAATPATPGQHNGRPYDAQQTRLRFNHIAVIPAGLGRAGRDCRILNTKGEQAMSKSFEEGAERARQEIENTMARHQGNRETRIPARVANATPRPRERSPLERLGFERPAPRPPRGEYQNAGEALAQAQAAARGSRLSMARAMDPIEAQRHLERQLANVRPLSREARERRIHNREVALARLGFRPDQEAAAPVRRRPPPTAYWRTEDQDD